VKDPAENDWTTESDFDVACAALGGVQEALEECKRRGLSLARGHLTVVPNPSGDDEDDEL
jgi:hypothetical protein